MLIIGITNRKLCTSFFDQIKKISKSKLNYLIIREKDLGDEELLKLALKVKEELKNSNIKLVVNSNINIAKQINADGVQLSFKDFLEFNHKFSTSHMKNIRGTVDNFRYKGEKYKVYKMIGVSIHSFEEGIEAYKLGADYLIYGHIFQTDCKKDIPPRGVKEIEEISRKIDIPIIGLGGIDKNNFKEVINSGAGGIAIMSSLMKDENPKVLIEEIIG